MRLNRFASIAVFGAAGLAMASSLASAGLIANFDSPFAMTNRYANWAPGPPPAATLTSNATNFEVSGTGYGSGYKQTYPTVEDASDGNALQLDINVKSGVAGIIVSLVDGAGNEWQYNPPEFYGLTPTGGIGGTDHYLLTVPKAPPTVVVANPAYPAAPIFYFDQIVGFHLGVDPGATTQTYDVTFNNWASVSTPEPASLAAIALAGTVIGRRRR